MRKSKCGECLYIDHIVRQGTHCFSMPPTIVVGKNGLNSVRPIVSVNDIACSLFVERDHDAQK